MSIEHIEINQTTIAQLFKLPKDMIDYLWERIDVAKKKKICKKKKLAGYISKSYVLDDPQNLIIRNLFNRVDNPKMFKFINTEVEYMNFRLFGSKKVMLEPYLSALWVNFQKKCEFQPVHNHTGMFSFVIWMDIPYDWKDEAKLPFAKVRADGGTPSGGNFTFVYSNDNCRSVSEYVIPMSPEINGYCCFFPSDLCHQVYPFYTSDKDRITISGNIVWDEVHKGVKQIPFIVSNT